MLKRTAVNFLQKSIRHTLASNEKKYKYKKCDFEFLNKQCNLS